MIFVIFLIQGLLNRVKNWKTRNELEYLINVKFIQIIKTPYRQKRL